MHKQKRKKRIWKIVILILAFFLIMIIGGYVSVHLYSVKNAVRYDEPDKMVAIARSLYQKERYAEALEQLAYYCQYYAQDDAVDLYLELGKWYQENGDPKKSDYAYNHALAIICPDLKRTMENEINGSRFRFRLEPIIGLTKNVHLMINGTYLTPPRKSVRGRISGSGNLVKQEDYRTTNWFPISGDMHTLLLTGEFNCAVWEFQNEKGHSTVVETGEIDLMCRTYVTVEIPENTVKCRVTYRQPVNGEYTEGYASVYCIDLPDLSGADDYAEISLPDLKENQFILYADGIWTLWERNMLVKQLDLPAVAYEKTQNISVLGDVCGDISITMEAAEDGNIP